MKTQSKKFAHYFGVNLFVLLVALFLNVGCATSRPDPLKGWTFRSFPGWGANPNGHNDNKLDQTITNDYQNFIAKNNLNLSDAITGYYEDETGKHAVEFTVFPPNQNATWNYILIYNKEDKRIKVIKYGYHRFQS